MKFNEKLYALRKESNLSQEQLADMLDVSRQSVSKWESGQTYPEMDKLLSICKIFKCSLDDITNDEVESFNTNTKNKFTIDTLAGQITKVIKKSKNMFKTMTKKQLILFPIEIIIVIAIILLMKIPFYYLHELGSSIFSSFGVNAISKLLSNILNFILEIAYIIFAVISFAYFYKIKYLDNYNENTKTPDETIVKDEKKKIVIDDTINPKKNTFDMFSTLFIFSILGSWLIVIFKIIIALLTIPFMLLLLSLFTFLAISVFLISKGIVFIGIILALLSSAALCILILLVLFNFIFNKKNNLKMLFLTLILGISTFGIGFGITITEITSFNYTNSAPVNMQQETKTEEIIMENNLMIQSCPVNYVVDETLGDTIKISTKYYKGYSDPRIENINNTISIYDNNVTSNASRDFNMLIQNLKDKTIYNYLLLFDFDTTIYATSKNIKIMNDNLDAYNKKIRDENYNQMSEYYEETIQNLQEENNKYLYEINEYKYQLMDLKNQIQSLQNIQF